MTPLDAASALHSPLDHLRAVRERVAERMFGMSGVIDALLIGLVTRGHVLLEGNPGLGKTTLVRVLSEELAMPADAVGRIQFTPDLMPSDITGTLMPDPDDQQTLKFRPGPIFHNLLLADEINRATAKTQAAMLEAMAERQVTVLGDRHPLTSEVTADLWDEDAGETRVHRAESPFMVMATQNPIDQEGTHSLPEAQLDRFLFKVRMPFPDADALGRIVEKDVVAASPKRPAPASSVAPASVLLDRAGRRIREARLSEAARRHVLNMVLASAGRLDQVDGLARGGDRKLQEFCEERLDHPLGPRAAVALTLAALGWTLLVAMRPGDDNDPTGRTVEGLAHVVAPALRHRMKFRGEFSGFEAGPGRADDQHDRFVEDFARLCAPQVQAHDQRFAAALEAAAAGGRAL